jgi:hypothetical protein
MFQTFRDTGIFVGNDAKYCCYEHPDSGLRGSLELQNIIEDGRIVNKVGLKMLFQHVFYRGLAIQEASKLQLLFAYKLCMAEEDMKILASW